MTNDQTPYAMNERQYEEALAVLQKEREACTPSPLQEKTFKYLTAAIYVYGIALLIWILVRSLKSIEDVAYPREIIYVIGFICFLLAILIVILFFVNLPYFRQFLRQRKLIRRMKLLAFFSDPWKIERSANRWYNLFDVGVRVPALFVGGIFVIFITYHALVLSHGMTELLRDLSMLTLTFAVVVANIGNYFALRSRGRLKIISRLLSSLEKSRKGGGEGEDNRVLVAPKEYEKIWEIERGQISRQRAQSILRSAEAGEKRCYAMRKSREASKAQAGLDATTRLRVQAQIDLLTTEPRPAGVTEDPKTETLNLRVPETSVIIGFKVDDLARLIKILSIDSASERTV